jgi:hypothetical protein
LTFKEIFNGRKEYLIKRIFLRRKRIITGIRRERKRYALPKADVLMTEKGTNSISNRNGFKDGIVAFLMI